jgi:hypothetical protein
MENPEEMVRNLNEMLDSDHFDIAEFDFLLKRFMEQAKISMRFLDLEYFNEQRMLEARCHKIGKEEQKDFNAAFEYREIERKCEKYGQLKSEFKIKKSTFYLYRGYLLYFCMGNGKNDAFIKSRLQ